MAGDVPFPALGALPIAAAGRSSPSWVRGARRRRCGRS